MLGRGVAPRPITLRLLRSLTCKCRRMTAPAQTYREAAEGRRK